MAIIINVNGANVILESMLEKLNNASGIGFGTVHEMKAEKEKS